LKQHYQLLLLEKPRLFQSNLSGLKGIQLIPVQENTAIFDHLLKKIG
jgi:hypothetical protein